VQIAVLAIKHFLAFVNLQCDANVALRENGLKVRLGCS
jgi:hypothetical protein